MIRKDQIEELEEPSITSSDPYERKLARRLRIQRRQQVLKKQFGPEKEENEEKSLSDKQILASAEQLENFITEGYRAISNVRVANDARELDRREKEKKIRQDLLKMLDDNSRECTERYMKINEKWSTIFALKDPLEIYASLRIQNDKCLEVLAMKDSAIAELKNELEEADAKFALDLKNQNEDIDVIIARINEQVNSMAKAYRQELISIENTLDIERNMLIEISEKKWQSLYKQIKTNEMNGFEERKKVMKEFEEEMNRVMIEHHEEYRAQKTKLGTECDKLELEIQQMKALCLLNVEKLNYNYTVLKRREEENAIVKNNQKRRLNKLQDTLSILTKSYVDLKEKTQLETQKLIDQILRAQKNISEIEAKSDYFSMLREKQYFEIWDMNTERADELLKKILETDKIIFEQVLGLEWEAPEGKILRKEDLPSYKKAITLIEEKRALESKTVGMCELCLPDITLEDKNQERKLLLHIMEQITDRTGFLVEEKLRELLRKEKKEIQILVTLDNVFQALSINSRRDIEMLLNFFLPYTYCPICTDKKSESETENVSQIPSTYSLQENSREIVQLPEDERTRVFIETVKNEINMLRPISCETSEISSIENTELTNCITDNAQIEGSETTGEFPHDYFNDLNKRKLLCDKGHLIEIEVTYVIKALREFLEKHHMIKQDKSCLSSKQELYEKKFTVSRNISAEDVNEFWKRYRDLFSGKRERLWDVILIGLNKYHDILKERHKINAEIESLRKQNSELRQLLGVHEKSKSSCRSE